MCTFSSREEGRETGDVLEMMGLNTLMGAFACRLTSKKTQNRAETLSRLFPGNKLGN